MSRSQVTELRRRRHRGQLLRTMRALFDPAYYAQAVKRNFATPDDAWRHYREQGAPARVSPHPLFDAAYYNRIYPDVQQLPDLFEHFLGSGDREGRRPHGLFERQFYRDRHGEGGCGHLDAAAWEHFLHCPNESLVPTPLWDPVLTGNPESDADHAQMRGREGFLHYLRGQRDRIASPHPLFDEEYILRRLNSGAGTPAGALGFYASRMGDERGTVSPNPLFDQAWFLAQHPEMDWLDSPLSYYLREGEVLQAHPHTPNGSWRELTGSRLVLTELVRALRWGGDSGTASPGPADQTVDAAIIDIDSPAITILSAHLVARAARVAGVDVNLFLLDNASADRWEAQTVSAYLPDARVTRINHRRSFGEANNLLAELGEGPLLLFINSDAFLPADSLTPLLARLRTTESAVAVGPTLAYPDGTVQESGGRLCDDGTAVQLAKGFRDLPRHLTEPRPVDYVSAACLLVRRDVFEAAGGFNFVFEPAYYEDTDLCLRLRKHGQIMVEPQVRVIHYEGHTTGRPNVLANKLETQSLSREKFLSIFNSEQDGRGRASGWLPAETGGQAVARDPNRPSALLYSPYGLMLGGGERYLLALAQALSGSWNVELAFDGLYSQLRLGNIQSQLGLPRTPFPLLDMAALDRRVPRRDLFVLMGNSLIAPSEPMGRYNVYHCQFPFAHPDDLWLGGAASLEEWDEVVVNSEFTARHYRAKASRLGIDPKVTVIPPPCLLLEPGEPPSQLTVVSVGRFFRAGHSKRQDAAVSAFNDLMREIPRATLTLFGGVANNEDSRSFFNDVTRQAHGLPVAIVPDASRDELEQGMRAAAFYWHTAGLDVPDNDPERHEHFGISVVEAMSAGAVPVVIGGGGPAAIVEPVSSHLVVSSVQELKAVTGEVWADHDLWRELRERAVEAAAEYGMEHFMDAVDKLAVRARQTVSWP